MLLKQKVAAHNPTSLSDLKQATKQVWMNEISVNYCEKLCLSMPERIDDVLKNKGGHTKYQVYFIECSVFVNCRFDIHIYLINIYFYMSHSLV